MSEAGPYSWVNGYKLDDVLSAESSDAVVDDVFDALDALLVEPVERPSVIRLRGTDRQPDTYLATLPHDYFVSYRVYARGIPPHAVPMLKVLDVGRMSDLFPET